MRHTAETIEPGLHLLATPIGAARDITLRALDLLRHCDVLAAEDTRTARKLMDIHGVPLGDRPLIAYHDHNGPAARPRLLQYLRDGKSVAYMSEAGTPLIADPGFQLGREAAALGVPVRAAPGASAVLAALCVAGLPTDRFFFAGFLPPTQAARIKALQELAAIPGTLVLYESPKRVGKLLTDMADTLGADRSAAVCRELTKKFEEVLRGPLGDLAKQVNARTLKGEIVVLVDRAQGSLATAQDVDSALRAAMEEMSMKDAVKAVAETLDLPRRTVYQAALSLDGKG